MEGQGHSTLTRRAVPESESESIVPALQWTPPRVIRERSLLLCMSQLLAQLCRRGRRAWMATIRGQAAISGDGASRLKMTLAV